jgi:hypothetical protein
MVASLKVKEFEDNLSKLSLFQLFNLPTKVR